MKKYGENILTNYQLLKQFNEKDYPFVQVEIKEVETNKTGFASILNNKIDLWYGDDDGSDDKSVSREDFNKLFIITNINLIAK